MFKRLRMAAAGFGVLAATAMPAFSQGTLRIGMTAADIPQTTGQPDQGFEGYRFAGYTIYDGLVNWDLSKADTIADIKPGLATEWAPVEGDPKRWIFKLRQGVKFHDGSDFDADVVVWNLEKILNDKSPQFDPKQAAQARGRVPTLVAWKAIDKHTVELSTRVVNALFPYDMSYIFYSSPTQWEKLGKDWVKFAVQPVGTGPFTLVFIPPICRVSESVTTQVRGFDFVDAARASGASALTIVRVHVLGNVLGPILVYATSLISVAIILAAGLSFLGLGVKPPEPEWGLMLNTLRQAIYVNPVLAALPGVMIFITSICFNLMSDGLRAAMDVKA